LTADIINPITARFVESEVRHQPVEQLRTRILGELDSPAPPPRCQPGAPLQRRPRRVTAFRLWEGLQHRQTWKFPPVQLALPVSAFQLSAFQDFPE